MSEIRAIELSGVTQVYGTTAALRDVNLRMDAGVVHFIRGPNGAGKSTLLGVLGTVLRPTRGTVCYEPFGNRPDLARAHIGWVAHDSRCYPDLSGRENIRFASLMYGERDPEAVEYAVTRTNVGPFADQPVGTLSRGQRQRVSLARALVHRPSVLLLDEPLTGLDAETAERFVEILTEERNDGTIVVVVTHTAGLAERLSGRTISVLRGRVSVEQ